MKRCFLCVRASFGFTNSVCISHQSSNQLVPSFLFWPCLHFMSLFHKFIEIEKKTSTRSLSKLIKYGCKKTNIENSKELVISAYHVNTNNALFLRVARSREERRISLAQHKYNMDSVTPLKVNLVVSVIMLIDCSTRYWQNLTIPCLGYQQWVAVCIARIALPFNEDFLH